uniref:Myotubularin related protein 11 n=1 Tax=Cynoglossus semilaevis TaxID=244447 RepID=A0A3P8VTC3_CYNSE
MLTGSKTTFKVRQMLPDIKERMLSQSGVNSRSRDVFGLHCLPGECILQRAVMVRKKLTAREGRGWLSGTLFCTHFRVAFVPQESIKPDDNADPVLLGDHDVALASIDKVVVVGPNRTKLMTPNSSLKFTPEELVLYCRDMQVICFLFDRLTPDAQVIEMTYTIVKTYQPLKPGSVLSFQNAALGSIEMKQFLSNRRRDTKMNWFETTSDWEQELARCAATGWRVSSVNDRFEMSTSLPRFVVVPQKVLDTELKKSFAHFNDGRIPRWCWQHPQGSVLLRMASFQNNIYHEKDDIRNLEMILFGCHSSLYISASLSVTDDKWLSTLESTHWLDYTRSCLRKASEVACLLRGSHLTVALQEAEDRDMSCVVSSLVQVMCDPYCRTQHGFQSLVQKDWVMAGHRFYSRMNYHRDNDKEEAPVFLLFLHCVWQLWSQYPSRFQLTEDFLLALHDSIHLPLFSSFLANCQRERCKRSQNQGQSYTPVKGWRDELPQDPSADLCDPPLPPVWDWALQYSKHRQESFTQPVATTTVHQPLLNGNLNIKKDQHKVGLLTETIPGSVFLFSRGTFSCPPNLLPWRTSSSGVYKKSHRRALSSEGMPGLEKLLKAWALADFPQSLSCNSEPRRPCDPSEPLLPLLLGPCMGLWRECFLRGALHAQAFSHPISANHPHPVERLAKEVRHLKHQLAKFASGTDTKPPVKSSEQRPTDTNSNQNANNSTFLFSASRPHGTCALRPVPAPTATHPQTSRGCPPATAPTSRPSDRDSSVSKHTFLFGRSSSAEACPGQRHYPTKVHKGSGSAAS